MDLRLFCFDLFAALIIVGAVMGLAATRNRR